MRYFLILTALCLGVSSPDLAEAAAVEGADSIAPEAPSPTVERRLLAMGTTLTIQLWGPSRGAALACSERLRDLVQKAEQRLSLWDPESEVSRWNAHPIEQPFPLSDATANELRSALAIGEQTGGAFEPMLGQCLRAWDLHGTGRVPARAECQALVAAIQAADVRETPQGWRRSSGATLATGGFGKGAALRHLQASLVESEVVRARVDLGGQWLLHGAADERFAIDIADPRHRHRRCVTLRVPAGSVATSSNSERSVEVSGERYGHLLDPRRAAPARDFGSVTVWCADPLRADALATALFVMGPQAGLAWAQEAPDVEALFLEVTPAGLRASATPAWQCFLPSNPPAAAPGSSEPQTPSFDPSLPPPTKSLSILP